MDFQDEPGAVEITGGKLQPFGTSGLGGVRGYKDDGEGYGRRASAILMAA